MALFHVILNLCMDKCFINRWFRKQDVKQLGDCHGVMGSYVSCHGYLLRVVLEALEEVYKLNCSGDGHSKTFWDGFLLRTVLGCSSEREL